MVLGKKQIICGVEAALPQAMVIHGFHRRASFIAPIDTVTKINEDDQGILHYKEGLFEALRTCYEEEKLPSEMKLRWSAGKHTVKF